MEAKGWIYWRKKRGRYGLGDVLLGGSLMDPGSRYVAEAREEHLEEEAGDGDDDEKRKPEDRVTSTKIPSDAG